MRWKGEHYEAGPSGRGIRWWFRPEASGERDGVGERAGVLLRGERDGELVGRGLFLPPLPVIHGERGALRRADSWGPLRTDRGSRLSWLFAIGEEVGRQIKRRNPGEIVVP